MSVRFAANFRFIVKKNKFTGALGNQAWADLLILILVRVSAEKELAGYFWDLSVYCSSICFFLIMMNTLTGILSIFNAMSEKVCVNYHVILNCCDYKTFGFILFGTSYEMCTLPYLQRWAKIHSFLYAAFKCTTIRLYRVRTVSVSTIVKGNVLESGHRILY